MLMAPRRLLAPRTQRQLLQPRVHVQGHQVQRAASRLGQHRCLTVGDSPLPQGSNRTPRRIRHTCLPAMRLLLPRSPQRHVGGDAVEHAACGWAGGGCGTHRFEAGQARPVVEFLAPELVLSYAPHGLLACQVHATLAANAAPVHLLSRPWKLKSGGSALPSRPAASADRQRSTISCLQGERRAGGRQIFPELYSQCNHLVCAFAFLLSLSRGGSCCTRELAHPPRTAGVGQAAPAPAPHLCAAHVVARVHERALVEEQEHGHCGAGRGHARRTRVHMNSHACMLCWGPPHVMLWWSPTPVLKP